MFFNLKYHIVSLVAVFLALGLGIFIGTAIPGSDALNSQQQELTSSLESQMGIMKQKNQHLQSRISTLEMDNNIQRQFESHVLPVLLADKLKGRKVAIIGTTGQRLVDDLVETFSLAGAGVQSITILIGFELSHGNDLSEKMESPESSREGTLRIAKEVAQAVLSGSTDKLKTLAGQNFIKIGGTYGGPVDDVILVGGSNDSQIMNIESLDFPLIDSLKSGGLPVYGVEESSAAYSYIKAYQKKGISTVDNVDTVPGQVSLVYAILGNPGQYGVKASARALWPAIDGGVPVNAR